jgi:hypothetical protein
MGTHRGVGGVGLMSSDNPTPDVSGDFLRSGIPGVASSGKLSPTARLVIVRQWCPHAERLIGFSFVANPNRAALATTVVVHVRHHGRIHKKAARRAASGTLIAHSKTNATDVPREGRSGWSVTIQYAHLCVGSAAGSHELDRDARILSRVRLIEPGCDPTPPASQTSPSPAVCSEQGQGVRSSALLTLDRELDVGLSGTRELHRHSTVAKRVPPRPPEPIASHRGTDSPERAMEGKQSINRYPSTDGVRQLPTKLQKQQRGAALKSRELLISDRESEVGGVGKSLGLTYKTVWQPCALKRLRAADSDKGGGVKVPRTYRANRCAAKFVPGQNSETRAALGSGLSPAPQVPEAATPLEHSPPHRECEDECHRNVVPPVTGETVCTASKPKGYDKGWHERRSKWRKFGVHVMRDTGYQVGNKGTAHYQQCQPEARSWSPHSHVCRPSSSASPMMDRGGRKKSVRNAFQNRCAAPYQLSLPRLIQTSAGRRFY